ncbi:MAG: diaminopimelate epimerase [Acidimicrobiales bacterium]|nr:diaminopimelate epimerase [Acidimicrobiales bacterium]
MHLTKHHGLGNDFLVCLTDTVPSDASAMARALCHRTTGIGADGLVFGTPAPGYDHRMTLYNADGSLAEMSGNGIRCFAQAIHLADGPVGELQLLTDGGPRGVRITEGPDALTISASVDMGPVGSGPAIPGAVDLAALGVEVVEGRIGTADLGNPHLVVQVPDPHAVPLAAAGAALEAAVPGGVNVEFIAPGGPDRIELVVWERGVGVTQACGTGACAAATLAHRWGLVGGSVSVHMPGGDARVVVGEHATLIGPAVLIAHIEVPDAS